MLTTVPIFLQNNNKKRLMNTTLDFIFALTKTTGNNQVLMKPSLGNLQQSDCAVPFKFDILI